MSKPRPLVYDKSQGTGLEIPALDLAFDLALGGTLFLSTALAHSFSYEGRAVIVVLLICPFPRPCADGLGFRLSENDGAW